MILKLQLVGLILNSPLLAVAQPRKLLWMSELKY